MTFEERAEQQLINAGGIHPRPWEIQEFSAGRIDIVDDNMKPVLIDVGKLSVAKAIVEAFNHHSVVILEDDVVY